MLGMAVIGSSGHAARVSAPTIERSLDAALLGVLGSTPDRGQTLAERHDGCIAYAELDSLLGDARVDAVWIASPNASHVAYATACLEAGKHVLVEKPLATRHEEAAVLQALAEQLGLSVKVGYQHRFRPPHTWLQNQLVNGRIGAVHLLRVHRCWPYPYFPDMPADPSDSWRMSPGESGGWVLNDIGSHLVDLALWLVGEPAELSVARTANFAFPDIPVEDTAILLLETASGALVTIETSNAFSSFPGTIEVHGSNGWLRAEGTFDGGGLVLDSDGERMVFPNVTPTQVHDYMLRDFVTAARGQASQGADAADAVVNVRIIERAAAGHSRRGDPLTVDAVEQV